MTAKYKSGAGSGKPISVFSVVMCFSIDANSSSLFHGRVRLEDFQRATARNSPGVGIPTARDQPGRALIDLVMGRKTSLLERFYRTAMWIVRGASLGLVWLTAVHRDERVTVARDVRDAARSPPGHGVTRQSRKGRVARMLNPAAFFVSGRLRRCRHIGSRRGWCTTPALPCPPVSSDAEMTKT
jgi:hypothetical protein